MLESIKRAYDRGAFNDNFPCDIDLKTTEIYLQILKQAYKLSIKFQKNSSNIADIIPNLLKLKDFWTFGKRNWLFRDYYSNGNLQTSRIFKNGREEGQTQSYHENGKLQIEFSYINGNREGGYIQYHENGKLSCVGQFENDKEVGEWLWYDEKGKLFQKDTYKEGQIIAIKNNQTKVADY